MANREAEELYNRVIDDVIGQSLAGYEKYSHSTEEGTIPRNYSYGALPTNSSNPSSAAYKGSESQMKDTLKKVLEAISQLDKKFTDPKDFKTALGSSATDFSESVFLPMLNSLQSIFQNAGYSVQAEEGEDITDAYERELSRVFNDVEKLSRTKSLTEEEEQLVADAKAKAEGLRKNLKTYTTLKRRVNLPSTPGGGSKLSAFLSGNLTNEAAIKYLVNSGATSSENIKGRLLEQGGGKLAKWLEAAERKPENVLPELYRQAASSVDGELKDGLISHFLDCYQKNLGIAEWIDGTRGKPEPNPGWLEAINAIIGYMNRVLGFIQSSGVAGSLQDKSRDILDAIHNMQQLYRELNSAYKLKQSATPADILQQSKTDVAPSVKQAKQKEARKKEGGV